MRIFTLGTILLTLLAAAPQSQAQDPDFKKLIEAGEYEKLGEKLEPYLDLAKADPKLEAYLKANLDYLARGAKPRVAGSEIIVVRGAKNDSAYQMPNVNGTKRTTGHPREWTDSYPSGGPRLMLPNRIRHLHMGWDKRLDYIGRYFEEATDSMGGNGSSLHELQKIIEHHKGGGFGTSANSTSSVLISTSTRPLHAFGPPYYIMKIAPERCIFNWMGLTNEYEVLIPFWILPSEIIARVDSVAEVEAHPAYQASKLVDIEVEEWSSFPSVNNWALIEDNIRNGRPPLPINADAADANKLTGIVSVEGSKVYVEESGKTYRIKPTSVARTLKKFKGREVRLDGEPNDSAELTFTVGEVLSPKERTVVGDVEVNGGEPSISTANGDLLETSGPIRRALSSSEGESVTVDGWVFTNSSDEANHIYLTAAYAKADSELALRSPSGATVPAGDMVRISYVSTTGRSAIVKHDNGWGWVKVSNLTLGELNPAGASGLAGILGNH